MVVARGDLVERISYADGAEPKRHGWGASDERLGSPAPRGAAQDELDSCQTMITIVVPTYRRPELLRECLDSLRGQTFENFIALVCDNAADSETESAVAALRDSRFKYVPRETNLGLTLNALRGYLAASTPFVMEVDDDDRLYPTALENLLRPFTDDPGLTMVMGRLRLIDERGNSLPQRMQDLFSYSVPTGRQQPFTELAARGGLHMIGALVRRDCLNWSEIALETGGAYDRAVAIAAARGGRAAHLIDEEVVYYRIHQGADGVGNTVGQFRGAVYALEAEMRHGSYREVRILRRQAVRHRLLLGRALLGDRRFREAAVALAPVARRATWGWALVELVFARRGSLLRSIRSMLDYAPHHRATRRSGHAELGATESFTRAPTLRDVEARGSSRGLKS